MGKTVQTDEALPDGVAVDILVHDVSDSSDFELTPELRAELREASEGVRRGEAVEIEQFLQELERR